jgi:UDP-N-acetylmuramate dehydrogenase
VAPAEAKIAKAEDLTSAVALSQREGLPLLPLGGGSNVVLPASLEAVVLRAADTQLRVLRENGDRVLFRIGAALPWHGLVLETLRQGFFGLENLALIPGLVGAAPVQNIGAYGREFDAFVEAVHGFDLDREEARELTRTECAFAYRDSIFKGELKERFLITAVDLWLSRRAELSVDYPSLAEQVKSGAYASTPEGICRAVIDLRRRRLPDPAERPNAGSFFKNPVLHGDALVRFRSTVPEAPVHPVGEGSGKLSAAWLIDRCGLRGHSRGAAAVSARHALVLENTGGARQEDILALARHVRGKVRERFAVELEAEPRIFPAGALDG